MATAMWFLFLGISCVSAALPDVVYAPPVVFSFPCNDSADFTQEFQVPANNDASSSMWKGVLYLDQWLEAANVNLDIVFDHPAVVTVNPRVAHVIADDAGQALNRVRLTTVRSPKLLHRIEFTVKAVEEGGEFPSVLSLAVNEEALCDNRGRLGNAPLVQGLAQGIRRASEETTQKQNACGVSATKDVIDWPWRISLFAKETGTNGQWTLFCGGTLIGPDAVLTAGRCVVDRNATDMLVEVGGTNVTVKEAILHHGFDKQSLKDDLAFLLINDGEVKKQRYPICQRDDWAVLGGENKTIGALDRTKNGQFQDMRVIDGITCLEANRKDFGKYLSTKNVCAKAVTRETQILPGDGLYEEFFDEKRGASAWKIKGVASFTNRHPYFIFTSVAKYSYFVGQGGAIDVK